MSTPMHFRKRQLLEYQVETNLKFLAEQRNKLYPSSPSSFDSETSSPVKDVTELPRVEVPTEYTPEKSTYSINDALQLTPNPLVSTVASSPPMKQEAEAWVDIATKLMQSIESNLIKERETDPSIDSKPSALLLAKLSILKVVLNNLPYVKGKLDTQRLYDIIGIDPSWLKEKSEVVAKSEVREEPQPTLPVEIKSKLTPDFPHSSLKVPESNQQLEPKPKDDYSQEELHHIGNRIKRILAEENRSQQRMEEFAESGIHVYEQADLEYPQRSDDILIRSNNKYTPPAEMPSTPKKPFVHITADTLPEELQHLTTVADNLNPSAQLLNILKPQQKYPYTLTDDKYQLIIGPNGTQMSKRAWYEIDWTLAAPAVTRKVLMGVFDRNTLATHSLSGRPSPAFMNLNKPEKLPLDVHKVADIVSLVTSRINVTPKEVRMAITSKCADECKIVKIRKQNKLKAIHNKENTRVEPYYIPVNVPKDQF